MRYGFALCCLLLASECLVAQEVDNGGERVLALASDYIDCEAKVAKDRENVWILRGNQRYAQGYFHGIEISLASCGAFSPPRGTTTEQRIAVIRKYVQDNPKEWHKTVDTLIQDALMEAWPSFNTEKFKAIRLP